MLRHWLARARHQLETQRVAASIAAKPAPSPPVLVNGDPTSRVWEVAIPGSPAVQMRPHMSDGAGYFAVCVDAVAFYLAMLRGVRTMRTSPHGNHCMARRDMHRDYKFGSADRGFAASLSSPVPLALAYVSKDAKGRLAIAGFCDGITRTYWLLASGARSFPVEVEGLDQALFLHEQAGVGPRPG